VLIKKFGEDAIIEELRKKFRKTRPSVVRAIGDDTAVVGFRGRLLSTTDTLVEGVHFKKQWAPPYFIGRKSLSISLSDIAAMGGRPLFFLLSMGLPPELDKKFLDELVNGIKGSADEFDVSLIGGNISEAPHICVTTTVLGGAEKDRIIYRKGARPGDAIYATGTLGDAFLGLKILEKKGLDALRKGPYKKSVLKHLDPCARVRVGSALAEKKLASAMIDVSDGLLRDLKRLTVESKVGGRVELEKIPISEDLKDYLAKHPDDMPQLHGGEDYELLFTARRGVNMEALGKKLGIRITAIGEITRKRGIVVTKGGRPIAVRFAGYEHFGQR
jgi:thiamine-monophosphate kinase